ncbi:MAG: ABC transporter ATP-binding protein [Bradymonadales bacterium]|nr:MAG: ABC transporter ATP-binding protein [Bradymonadales bacterium]
MLSLIAKIKDAPFFSHRWSLWRSRKSFLKGALILVFVNLMGLSFPLFVKVVIDRLEGRDQAWWVPVFLDRLDTPWFVGSLCALFLCFIALMTIGRYYWRVFFVFVGFPRTHEVRQLFYKNLLSQDAAFLRSRRVGDLISALSEDSDKIRMTLSFGGIAICDTILNVILFSSILFLLDWKMAAMVIPALVLGSILLVYLSDRLSALYESVQNLIGNLTGFAFEIASGVRVIKAFGREKEFHQEFVRESRRLESASVRVARYQSSFVPILYFFLGLATCFVMFYGGSRVLSGELAISSFIAFQLYLVQMDWPMMAIGWFVELFRGSSASEKRMRRIAETPSHRVIRSGEEAEKAAPEFELKKASFAYSENVLALDQIDLKIEGGQWIGLTGPVGSGKSSLLELLTREIDPSSGEVFWRGRNLKSFSPPDLSSQILFVPQETYLFSQSLRNNLLFGGRGRADEDLLDLLKELSFDLGQLVDRGGLWARLGERGTNFSGGQKQRIAIGRALLQKKAVYLFDDIFSHLDAETELKILETLRRRIPAEATVFFVSQRLETLELQDQILVLQSGRLEFFGQPRAAMSESRFIQELRHLQREQMLIQEVAG